MAQVAGPQGPEQHLADVAASAFARTQSPGKHLAVHAPQLAVKPHLQILRRYRRPLLLCLEYTDRPTLEDHVHCSARLGNRASVVVRIGIIPVSECAKTPPGLLRVGRCHLCRSVAIGPAAARPDQAEGLAAFVIEEVGVDRRREARIVELDREVIAALAGALRPRGADLGTADKDPVAWRVVAGPVGLRNDADAFGLDAEGDDLALELIAGLLEGTDGCHVVSP